MASIRKKFGKSKYFYACYTDREGVQQQQSTKTTDRKLAQEIADELERPYREKTTISHLRKSFAKIAQGVQSKASFGTTVREYFERWLQEIRGEPGAGTYVRYKQIVRDSLQEFGPVADQPIDEVGREDFIRVRLAVAERSSPKNSNTYVKVLKRIMRAAVDDELRTDDPVKKIGFLNEEEDGRQQRRPFTDDELKKLRAVLTGEWGLIVHFGEHTGQRLGDIVNCTRQQLDLEARVWVFYSEKTKRNMRVPLTPSLLAALTKLPPGAPSDPIFPDSYATKQKYKGETRRLSAEFRSFLEAAGLAPRRGKVNTGRGHRHRRTTNELSYHSLRHNATSNLKKAGVPEAVVRDIIGHESELVSRGYTHLDDTTKVQAVERIDER